MYIFVAIILPLVGLCFANPGCNPKVRVDCGEMMKFVVVSLAGEKTVCTASKIVHVNWDICASIQGIIYYIIFPIIPLYTHCLVHILFLTGYYGISESKCTFDRGCCWNEDEEV